METKEYSCPQCGGQLKIDGNIIFAATNPSNQQGILVLHPELGNYTAIHHPDFVFKEGDLIEFHCPLCSANLSSSKNKNLAKVELQTEGKKFDIYFSKIAGEKCTYQLIGEHLSLYGQDKKKYVDFFNLSQMM